MKTHNFFSLKIGIVILFIALLTNGCGTNKNDVFKIGAILPLTGEGAEWGITSKNAILLALNETNKNNKNIQFEVFVEDSKTSSKDALNALNKLSSQNVKFIIGDIISSNVLSMAPIVEKKKIILISPGASNPDISNAGDYIFRTWQSDALEAQIDASYIIDTLQWKKIVILYLENGYGTGLANEFKKCLSQNNIEPVLSETFKVGQANFRDIISKIRNIKPDGIYLASYPEENFNLLKQLEEQKVKIKILGTQGFISPKIEELIPSLSYPICYSIPQPPDSSSLEVKSFLINYQKLYGSKPGITGDAAYDAFNLIANGIKLYGYDADKVKEYLYSVKNFSGASGILTFNKVGDVVKPFIFIKNKHWSK